MKHVFLITVFWHQTVIRASSSVLESYHSLTQQQILHEFLHVFMHMIWLHVIGRLDNRQKCLYYQRQRQFKFSVLWPTRKGSSHFLRFYVQNISSRLIISSGSFYTHYTSSYMHTIILSYYNLTPGSGTLSSPHTCLRLRISRFVYVWQSVHTLHFVC